MTSLPRPFCPECRQPLGATGEQVAVYGLTGEHYGCAMERKTRGDPLKEGIFDPEWRPIPDKLDGVDTTGWLAPDGAFYGCRSYVHIALGCALAEYFSLGCYSEDLEKTGWAHVSKEGVYFRGDDRDREPTQAQFDALWDWYVSIKDRDDAERTLLWSLEHRLRKREEL